MMLITEALEVSGCPPVIRLQTATKKKFEVKWRQIYFYYMVRLYCWTLQDAGDIFRKSHATVLHFCNKVEDFRQFDKAFDIELISIETNLDHKYKNEMNYRAYFSIESKLKSMGFKEDRSYLIDVFTDGKKDSLKALTSREYILFIAWLKEKFSLKSRTKKNGTVDNRMRQKLWVLFVRKMSFSQADYEKWVITHGKFHKPINKHTHQELVALVSQAELVYTSWLQEVKKGA